MSNDEDQALATLNEWLAGRGNDVTSSTRDAWRITPYRDGHVFSSGGGRRANVLYIVRGSAVVAFSPSIETLDAAYDRAQP